MKKGTKVLKIQYMDCTYICTAQYINVFPHHWQFSHLSYQSKRLLCMMMMMMMMGWKLHVLFQAPVWCGNQNEISNTSVSRVVTLMLYISLLLLMIKKKSRKANHCLAFGDCVQMIFNDNKKWLILAHCHIKKMGHRMYKGL